MEIIEKLASIDAFIEGCRGVENDTTYSYVHLCTIQLLLNFLYHLLTTFVRTVSAKSDKKKDISEKSMRAKSSDYEL